MGDPRSPLEKAKATRLRYWLPSSAVATCSSQQNLSAPFVVLYAAALIRGNRNNCTQFSRKLDWLVSKLERLESSSGNVVVFLFLLEHCRNVSKWLYVLSVVTFSGILEVLHCILVESPEALNIIQRAHIKSIISLLYKHGRNHKVGKHTSAAIQAPTWFLMLILEFLKRSKKKNKNSDIKWLHFSLQCLLLPLPSLPMNYGDRPTPTWCTFFLIPFLRMKVFALHTEHTVGWTGLATLGYLKKYTATWQLNGRKTLDLCVYLCSQRYHCKRFGKPNDFFVLWTYMLFLYS